MNKIDCAENHNLSESLARLPRILPYCSRPVTIAFVYARCCSVIPPGRRESRELGAEIRFPGESSR